MSSEIVRSCTVTLTGTPAFSSFFAGLASSANIEYQQPTTFSGAATGPRFLIHDNASIFAAGKDTRYLPGSVDGRVYGSGTFTDYTEPYESYQVLASDFALADVATAQQLFPAASDILNLLPGEMYMVEAYFLITRAAGTTSHTVSWVPGGAVGTGGSATWDFMVSNPTGATLGNAQQISSSDLSAVVLTAANTSATEHIRIRVRGIWRAGSTTSIFQPNIQYSAAPGGVPTVKKDSWMRAIRLGKSDISAVGIWT